LQWLADRGQRRAHVRGGLYIVESDNGQIFGDTDFQLTGRLVNAHGL